jgi:hypothetical protein
MTTRKGSDQFMRELKASLMTRVAQRAMTTRTTGLDGLAKRVLDKSGGAEPEMDPDLEHPDDWDRPID